jgi:hypothetical protein
METTRALVDEIHTEISIQYIYMRQGEVGELFFFFFLPFQNNDNNDIFGLGDDPQ